ncbi:MAG: class I SAM-dependent methyltransferase [Chthoniobacterales bacterium]
MASGVPQLIEEIRATIRARGPVSFAWFMEQALYHPTHGYYSSGRAKIGRSGDYFSNVSVGPLFGRLMAAQFAEMWEKLGRPNEFKIVEQGAHEGDFARDVLETARELHPEFFDQLRYVIVEPFPILQTRQAERLIDFAGKVEWYHSLGQLASFRGVHFSNELLDAMPVHLVKWSGTEWLERGVTETADGFSLVDLPISDVQLRERVLRIPLPLPEDYETEINLEALRWIDGLAARLDAGFVVAVDYGFTREDFYAPHRTRGTLQCYANHRVLPSPFTQIGEADITSHVEWTSLTERAAVRGLTSAGLVDQHHFITGLLNGPLAQKFETWTEAKTKRALHTLMHPGFLGMKFQFLVLAKNVGQSATTLSGLQFAKPLL